MADPKALANVASFFRAATLEQQLAVETAQPSIVHIITWLSAALGQLTQSTVPVPVSEQPAALAPLASIALTLKLLESQMFEREVAPSF